MRRRALFVALVLGFAGVACQVVAGLSRVEQVDPPADAVPEAAPEAAPPPDPCVHVVPPGMPGEDDEPNAALDDFYIAVRSFTLVAPSSGPPLGFDLDGVCSCDSRPATARDGGQSCQTTQSGLSAGSLCDGDGGIDNQLATFASDFALVDLDKATNVNARIQTGKQTSLIVISGYNGRANDRNVNFGIFTSEGIPDTQPVPGCPDAGAESGHLFPGWCGKDKWTVSAPTVLQNGATFKPTAQGAGYVSNYRFVVRLANTALVPFAGYRLALGSPVASGLLVPLDANLVALDTSRGPPTRDQIAFWRLEDGVLAGRIPIADLLAGLGTLNSPAGGGASLCGAPEFALVKSKVCGRPDINVSANLDFVPGAACDALSTAIGLTGASAAVGDIVAPDASVNGCAPATDGAAGPIGFPNVTYRCP